MAGPGIWGPRRRGGVRRRNHSQNAGHPFHRRRMDGLSGPLPLPPPPYAYAGASWPFALSAAEPAQQQSLAAALAAAAAAAAIPTAPPVATNASQESRAAPVETRAGSPPEAPSDTEHSKLQELLRRIMELEFAGRCTHRSIAILKAICETLCVTPAALIKVMEVVNESFDAAVKNRQQPQLLNCWYVVDAVMKSFREKPKMLGAMEVALPHLLLQYVPWKGSELAKQPWVSREADSDRYEHLFETWGSTLSAQLHEAIMDMWEGGILPGSSKETFSQHS